MDIAAIQKHSQSVLQLLDGYSNPHKDELAIDAVLFAYLKGRGVRIERQYPVEQAGGIKPKRIDFRTSGVNPIVMELAVRPNQKTSGLSASTNKSELLKLCRVSDRQARKRVLLLFDFAKTPMTREILKRSYDKSNAGRGRFLRKPVRVIYVHKKEAFHFLWRPKRQVTNAKQ